MKTINYEFDAATVDLIVEALSALPYRRVAQTIQAIVAHANATLSAPVPPPQPVEKPAPRRRGRKPKQAQEPAQG